MSNVIDFKTRKRKKDIEENAKGTDSKPRFVSNTTGRRESEERDRMLNEIRQLIGKRRSELRWHFEED